MDNSVQYLVLSHVTTDGAKVENLATLVEGKTERIKYDATVLNQHKCSKTYGICWRVQL